MDYAELSCQSAFSFLRGASEPETLVERAAELGYAALALTDRDGLYGAPRLHAAAKQVGLPAVHGTTLTLSRRRPRDEDGTPAGADDRVVLLAEDEGGWRSLCRLVTAARHRSRTEPTTPLADLCAGSRGLLVLAGPHLPEEDLAALYEGFGADRCSLAIHDRLLRRDRRGQALQLARAGRFDLPLVVTGGVRFARRADKPVHDVLTCVRHKTTLDDAATKLLPNGEFHLRPRTTLAQLFRHCPEALARTVGIAERCRFSLDRLAYRFPPFEVPSGETPFSWLHRCVHAGARRRYQPLTPAVARQLAKELDLIERLDLAGYFLVVHDIVRFCEEQRILCQGRGSAANSAVCYALGITAVDPVGMELLFERFLSEGRGEMPDIDLDIAHQDREQVLQYVYRRYGREHAAMAAEAITYRARSAVRDAGKALGFSVQEVGRLAKGLDRRHDGDSGEIPEAWAEHGDDPRLPLLWKLARALHGLPRHLSIHVGGMVITGPPLNDIMPTEPAAMQGRTVVPWDKDDLQTLGIIKIDLLGLGMLTVLDRALRSLNAQRASAAAEPYRLHTVPQDDPATWDLLCRADTVGVFQVESRAQMNCLPRLRPRTFYDLVIEVALIRPGPIQGDMVHPYLRRRAGREPVTYPHPSLEPILRRTLGVPLFQEQGMKIAVAAAGFTPGEADELRRAMGHKRSHERMAQIAEKLVAGMARSGIPRPAAERIFKQLSAFADYGFPESHSASFAKLVWVSAWLKQRHPEHFLCALLNAQPMGFYPPAVLVSDARRHGVGVLPVDVLQSEWDCTLQWAETGASEEAVSRHPVLSVRLGFSQVRGLGEKHAAGVRAGLASVADQGPFTDPEDFARRTGLGRRSLEHLARLGALRGFDARRRQALWRVAQLGRRVPGALAEPLPAEPAVVFRGLGAVEAMVEDYALSGISIERHPIAFLRSQLDAIGVRRARDLATTGSPTPRPAVRDGEEVWVAGMAICRQRPGTAGGMTFVTLEDETGFVNLIVTPHVAEQNREGLRAGLMLAVGRVECADRVVNVRVARLHPLDDGRLPEGVQSHDYR